MSAGDPARPAAPGLAALALPAAFAVAAFAVDRAVKWWVMDVMALPERVAIDVAPPFLRLVMAWNTGANFGLGSQLAAEVWIGIALAISAALVVWATRMRSPWRRVSVGLIVGGALGNALDRAIYGAVADFLNMSCCGIHNPFAFNPADIFIFAGAAGLILLDASDSQSGGPPDGPSRKAPSGKAPSR